MNEDSRSLTPVEMFRRLHAEDPTCYYSKSQDVYVHQDSRTKEWRVLSKHFHEDYLKHELGFSNRIGDALNAEHPTVSDVDWSKIESRNKHSVEAALSFDGNYEGEIYVEGKKYLNLEGTQLPVAEIGEDCPVIRETIRRFFGEESSANKIFRSLPAVYYDSLWGSTFPSKRVKTPLVTVTDSRQEGELFQQFFSVLLGGKYFHYWPNTVNHAKDQLAAIHWRIDILPPFAQKRTLTAFLERFLKQKAVFYKAPGNEQITIPFWPQKSISLIAESRELAMIEDVLPRHDIYVLRLLPLGGYEFDLQEVWRELPYFLGANEVFSVPPCYVDPEVKLLCFKASAAGNFFKWLSEVIQVRGEKVVKSIAELRQFYGTLPPGDLLRGVLRRDEGTLEIYLEEISKHYPEQVTRISDTHWRFCFPP